MNGIPCNSLPLHVVDLLKYPLPFSPGCKLCVQDVLCSKDTRQKSLYWTTSVLPEKSELMRQIREYGIIYSSQAKHSEVAY